MMGLEFSSSNKILKHLKNLKRYSIIKIAEDYNGCSANLIDNNNSEYILFEDLEEIIKKAEKDIEEIYSFI